MLWQLWWNASSGAIAEKKVTASQAYIKIIN
jgi:hypothetical protein